MPALHLLKTEPDVYSYDDLVRDKKTVWDGVTNNTALINIRAMKPGDEALIYHTGEERAIAGLARVTKGPFEDPGNPGLNARGEPKFAVVELEPVKPAKRRVTLADIKADHRFADFVLVKQARLSVMPVPPQLATPLREMAGL